MVVLEGDKGKRGWSLKTSFGVCLMLVLESHPVKVAVLCRASQTR